MYDSYILSRHYPMFVEHGFPQLDIRQWPDGEWAVREFVRAPVVPSLTPWRYVLKGLRNVEISWPFIAAQLSLVDPRARGFLARHEAETARMEHERAVAENEKAERVLALGKQLSKNDDLMNDAARMGIAAFDLAHIGKTIYKERPWKLKDL